MSRPESDRSFPDFVPPNHIEKAKAQLADEMYSFLKEGGVMLATGLRIETQSIPPELSDEIDRSGFLIAHFGQQHVRTSLTPLVQSSSQIPLINTRVLFLKGGLPVVKRTQESKPDKMKMSSSRIDYVFRVSGRQGVKDVPILPVQRWFERRGRKIYSETGVESMSEISKTVKSVFEKLSQTSELSTS